jgi:hypothetical protein
VEYVIDHRQEEPLAMQLVQRLHAQALVEVLRMRNLTPEQLGLDYQALLELIGRERALELIGPTQALEMIGRQQALDIIGKDRALDIIGKDRALDIIGKDQALDIIGKDQALDIIGEDEVRRWLARRHPASPSQTESPPTSP